MEITFVQDTAEAMDLRGDRPFRAPHYSCSEQALLSEVALAAGGILFLDEIERFQYHVLRRALGVVRSMECQQHPHTPRVVATCSNTLAMLVEGGFTLSNGRAERAERAEREDSPEGAPKARRFHMCGYEIRIRAASRRVSLEVGNTRPSLLPEQARELAHWLNTAAGEAERGD